MLHDDEGGLGAAPETLDADRRCHSVQLLALHLQVPVPLLNGDGRAVVKDAEHQGAEDHVVQHHRERERAVVVLRAVGHLEQLVRDRDVAALADALPALRGRHLVCTREDCLQEVVLVAHQVAALLHDAEGCGPVEVGQDARLREVRVVARHEVLRRRGRLVRLLVALLALLLILRSGFLAPQQVDRVLCVTQLRLGLRRAILRLPVLPVLLRGRLVGLGILLLRLELRDVGARLRRQRRDGAVHLRPVQGQPVVDLAPQHLHELRAGARVEALELQVVVRRDARRVQRLPHGDEHLGRQEHVAVVRRQAAEDQDRHALVRRRDLPVVAVLDGRHVCPERREGVAWVGRHLLAHRDDLLREEALDRVEVDGLVPEGVARPPHSGREELRGDVRQEVPGDREQQVRGQVRVLPGLVVDQTAGRGHAETPLAQLLVGQLAADRHLGDGALQGALDLLQHLLDLLGQVPIPGVHIVPDVRRAREESHQHGAGALVRLALLALQEDHLLVVAVAPEVPLHEDRRGVLEFLAKGLHPPAAEDLHLLVYHDLHVQLRLEAPPVALEPERHRVDLLHKLPRDHAVKVGLDVGRLPALHALQLALSHTPGHALDLPGAGNQQTHGAAPVEVAAVGVLDDLRRREEHAVAPAGEEAAEAGLEASEVAQHLPELLAHQHAPEDRLEAADAVDELGLVVLGLVLAEPALQEGGVLAVVAVDLLDIPHHLALLDHDRGLRLALDPPARDRAADVLLQDGDRLLLVSLAEDVGRVVRDHVVLEVVEVAVDARGESRGLQTLEVPVLFRRLQECGLEGVRVEEQPGIAAARAILVRLVVARQEAAAVREAGVQQRHVIPETRRLGA
mmetsp:Transcript_61346/g.161213  ORF Transcript_61346/g.161213 Transcript_61346/m.161213 type:complete len:852 (-) Transcript_61346:1664-4219(-)